MLESGIQDFADNITRFLVVAAAPIAGGSPTNKTTVVFTLANEAGALFKALSVFALRGIDLTKLESRPIPGRPWEYLFYVDLAVGAEDARCNRALGAPGRVRAHVPQSRVVCVHAAAPFDGRGPCRGGRRSRMSDLNKHKSAALTDGPNRAAARAMLKACGFTDEDLAKPLVGVANTWTEIGPCNFHLRVSPST